MSQATDFIWMNGQLVRWQDATVHVHSQCALRGANVFEGIRAYWNDDRHQLHLFRVHEHWARLRRSMKIMRLQLPFTMDQIHQALLETITANSLQQDIHVRAHAYFGESTAIGVDGLAAFEPGDIETGLFIIALPKPTNLQRADHGLHCRVSSWTRISDRSVPPRIKAGANYQNSRLAMVEARTSGFQSAIFLNDSGHVSEGPGACIFILRDGTLITPPVTSGILESITRDSLIQLARTELHVDVIEREIDRTELYVADEVFFCGSGAEITPILSIDHYQVGDGNAGRITRQLRQLYYDVVTGRAHQYERWLTPVEFSGQATEASPQ